MIATAAIHWWNSSNSYKDFVGIILPLATSANAISYIIRSRGHEVVDGTLTQDFVQVWHDDPHSDDGYWVNERIVVFEYKRNSRRITVDSSQLHITSDIVPITIYRGNVQTATTNIRPIGIQLVVIYLMSVTIVAYLFFLLRSIPHHWQLVLGRKLGRPKKIGELRKSPSPAQHRQ